jgi:signal recognition particle GTPase
MFENLSDRLERSFKILKGEGKITEINVAETLKDVRRALLDADVNYKVAKTVYRHGKGESIRSECAHRHQAWTAHGQDRSRRAGSSHGW